MNIDTNYVLIGVAVIALFIGIMASRGFDKAERAHLLSRLHWIHIVTELNIAKLDDVREAGNFPSLEQVTQVLGVHQQLLEEAKGYDQKDKHIRNLIGLLSDQEYRLQLLLQAGIQGNDVSQRDTVYWVDYDVEADLIAVKADSPYRGRMTGRGWQS